MEYNEDDFLLLSGIQHFVFCARQWALIYIEQQWDENSRTVEGKIMHENAHNEFKTSKRNGVITSCGMPVFSRTLGVNGVCDIVEFIPSQDGISLTGKEGLYRINPVEYKHGEPKKSDADILQLTAQAMCLEQMLCCTISYGDIFYGKIKRRLHVYFDNNLRKRVIECFEQMHAYYQRRYTPKIKRIKSCNACSVKNICMPELFRKADVSSYIDMVIKEKNI